MASALVDQNQLECSPSNSNLKELQTKADDLDYLVTCMKEKVKESNRREKLQVLTLTPRYGWYGMVWFWMPLISNK